MTDKTFMPTAYQYNSLRLDLKESGKIIHEQQDEIERLKKENTSLKKKLGDIMQAIAGDLKGRVR